MRRCLLLELKGRPRWDFLRKVFLYCFKLNYSSIIFGCSWCRQASSWRQLRVVIIKLRNLKIFEVFDWPAPSKLRLLRKSSAKHSLIFFPSCQSHSAINCFFDYFCLKISSPHFSSFFLVSEENIGKFSLMSMRDIFTRQLETVTRTSLEIYMI